MFSIILNIYTWTYFLHFLPHSPTIYVYGTYYGNTTSHIIIYVIIIIYPYSFYDFLLSRIAMFSPGYFGYYS